jgi:hypothetical protein
MGETGSGPGPDWTPTDEATVHRMVKELLALGPRPVRVEMRPFDAYVVVGLIQFAWRNPQLDDKQKGLLEEFGRGLTAALGQMGAAFTASVLEDGWDRALDRPISGGRT